MYVDRVLDFEKGELSKYFVYIAANSENQFRIWRVFRLVTF